MDKTIANSTYTNIHRDILVIAKCVLGAMVAIAPFTTASAQGISLPATPPLRDLVPQRSEENGMWGYAEAVHDRQDKPEARGWHIPPQFEDARLFSEGIAAVRKQGLWGFIDENGNALAQPAFDDVGDFLGGYAPVCRNSLWGVLGRQGGVVIPLQFEWVGHFTEGVAVACVDGRYGYINRSGSLVVPPAFDDAQPFFEGLAVVERDGKKTYLRKDGSCLTPYVFDDARSFKSGVAAVQVNGAWGIIDCYGKVIAAFEFEDISESDEGLIPVKKVNGKWGVIGLDGRWAVEPVYDTMGSYMNGLANATRGDRFFVIDASGVPRLEGPIEDSLLRMTGEE